MRARLEALVLALLFTTACTPETAGAPPANPRAPDPPAMGASLSVPAGRWHVVLIAGDNNSPAFDNGVRAMRDRLTSSGVRDIRAFTSDPAANPSLPVATAANVSGALRGGGGDACLAFITSHGDETGFVLKAANGTVGPSTLDSALDTGCGTRPTVVVVSACHSGVFLSPAMRQPNRIVLTAAASDRASFGCGAGDRYTYYDQCLLQQFDMVSTWQQLAQATRICVENLERRMGVTPPSRPQTFIGAAVAGLRLPGR
ncbi:MAG: C13 family peptidase [Reyranellaceae bacterium]